MIGNEIAQYAELLSAVRQRIAAARSRAALAVNSELIKLYWDVGKILDTRTQQEGWGSRVVKRLAADISNDLPDVRGLDSGRVPPRRTLHATRRVCCPC